MKNLFTLGSSSARPLMYSVVTVLSIGNGVTFAQGIPTDYTNLQILPKDITRAELVPIMRDYASSLGVRCSFCHTVSNELDRPDDDFTSDEKPTKLTARMMMEMVAKINSETISQLPERGSPPVEVSCKTCHGGVERPVPIEMQLMHGIETTGVDTSIATYRQLRDRYLGTRAYDFGFQPLNRLVEQLIANGQSGAAVRVAELNAEFHPASLPTISLLGQAHESANDAASAAQAYQALINLDPETPFYDFYARQARERLEVLQ